MNLSTLIKHKVFFEEIGITINSKTVNCMKFKMNLQNLVYILSMMGTLPKELLEDIDNTTFLCLSPPKKCTCGKCNKMFNLIKN